jgi:hypothetical protein
VKIYSKETLIEALREIRSRGWIPNARPGNAGGVGNTLEDLLGIQENNLPIPNAAEWELKCQRAGSASLTTLFHTEPSPQALRFVPQILLPNYGWMHKQAGGMYGASEKSFRQTINGLTRTDRGFMVVIDRRQKKVLVSFDAKSVSPRHVDWLASVKRNIGLGELTPQPYWGFSDLFHIAGTKLKNSFYVTAQVERRGGLEYFLYHKIMMLREFDFEKFLRAIEQAYVLVDFDARTGHNHGTKFRLRQDRLPELYDSIEEIK